MSGRMLGFDYHQLKIEIELGEYEADAKTLFRWSKALQAVVLNELAAAEK